MSIYTDLIKEDSPVEFVNVMNAKSELMDMWDAPNDSQEFWERALVYYDATIAHRTIQPYSGGEVFDYVELNLRTLGWIK